MDDLGTWRVCVLALLVIEPGEVGSVTCHWGSRWKEVNSPATMLFRPAFDIPVLWSARSSYAVVGRKVGGGFSQGSGDGLVLRLYLGVLSAFSFTSLTSTKQGTRTISAAVLWGEW